MKFFFMMLGLLCLLSIPTKAWPNVRLLRKEIRKPILKDEDRMVFPGKPSFHEVNLKMADQILLFANMLRKAYELQSNKKMEDLRLRNQLQSRPSRRLQNILSGTYPSPWSSSM